MDFNVFADILLKKILDSECNDPCDVNIEETCGAVWEIDVYNYLYKTNIFETRMELNRTNMLYHMI